MILDISAIVTILLRETGSDRVLEAVEPPTPAEWARPLLWKQQWCWPAGWVTMLLSFLQEINVDVLSFGDTHWGTAQSAFVRYGKGRHPAALNFGECLTYATAYVAGEPLLCVGEDFVQTDLDLVLSTA